MAQKGTVLIVDDNVEFRQIYGDRLKRDGYQVIEAEDGVLGLAKTREQKVDIILSDIVMPNKDGFELIQELKASPETTDIPIIVLSVLGNTEEVTKGLELGASDYLIKGMYSPNDVLSKVGSLLARSDIKKFAPKYSVYVKEAKGDAIQLVKDLGFTNGLMCEKCEKERVLELIPEIAHEGWFQAQFKCEC